MSQRPRPRRRPSPRIATTPRRGIEPALDRLDRIRAEAPLRMGRY